MRPVARPSGVKMLRQQWNEIESQLQELGAELRDEYLVPGLARLETYWRQQIKPRSKESNNPSDLNAEGPSQDFTEWAKTYLEQFKSKAESVSSQDLRERLSSLLRQLGVNEDLLLRSLNQNKREVFDPLLGEVVAILSLVLGWKKKDKEEFSQALGEIGVVGLLAAKPLICLIAICGLAVGYQKHFHRDSFHKGGVLGLAGVTAMALTPAGLTGLLIVVVLLVYLNQKISNQRPVGPQVRTLVRKLVEGEWRDEAKESWNQFEAFMEELWPRYRGQKYEA
jgi:hypothetical protein